RGPVLLRRLLMKQILLRFAGAELFLVGIMMIADLFSSMWRFLAMEAPLGSILLWVLAGFPAHLTEVLPIAYLFGITLTLAEMHTDGELLVVFGSGISVQSLSLPVVVFSLLMAGTMFIANDFVTIPSSVKRDKLYGTMTGQKGQGGQVSDIAILAKGGRFVYRVGSYDPLTKRIMNVDIVERDDSGEPESRVIAPRAEWSVDRWKFIEARIFSRKGNGEWTEAPAKNYSRADIDENPDSFGIIKEKPVLMKTGELGTYIRFLGSSGLPSAEAKVEYNKRFSFLFTPIIVCGLSVAVAGWFRKNSLLMSLLFSLGTATVYYVAQMLGSLSAKTGWVQPALAVWGVTAAFLLISFVGYFRART
ncbi:MAG TPA: LptF/LptG family permease, partial [Rectinemataceae bacterium]|nr:LptF/LptG family permease [Rectinemataceae bacterium]